MKFKFTQFLAAAGIGALALVGAAQAQTPQEQLQGKTIRLVVGYAAGGGFDVYARMLAPHLAEYLGATIIVDNRPGGGGQTASNQVFREKPDGLTQYLINGVPSVLGQVVNKPGVAYDMTKFTWLSRVNAETWALMVNNDTPYQNLDDIIKTGNTLTLAALSRADGPSDGAAAMCASLDLPCRIVLGFEGTSEASLAVVRGEAEAIVMTDTSVAEQVTSGQARAIAVLGSRRSIRFPDVPTVSEQVELTEDGKFWNDYRANIADVGRSIIAPPGMDSEMTEYLRAAWESVLTDPDVVAEGLATQRDIEFLSGAESQELVDQIFGAAQSDRSDEVNDVLLNRYFH